MAKADDENLDYVLVDHGSSLRIHTTAGKGVGRRGRTETFVEVHLDLLPSDRAGYLWLLFSGQALSKDGSFSRILETSQDNASDLGSRLRDRIYDFVVPRLGELSPFHFPIAFPEVFLRDRAGFDVILGNPPWEEATLEEDDFWSRYLPGFQSLPQHEQEAVKKRYRKNRPDLVEQFQREVAQADALRNVLTTGPFPGMGTGDADVYKAFCWRFWSLLNVDGGAVGVVLPRAAWCAKGTTEFRRSVLEGSRVLETAILVNRRGWVFPGIHEQNPEIALTIISRGRKAIATKTVNLRGPFTSLERFNEGIKMPPVAFAAVDVLGWTDSAALPLLPAEDSAAVFAQIRKAPRLDHRAEGQWRARAYRELDATNDKNLMKLAEEQPAGYWPVYKGESFDIWEPDRGVYYAWANPEKLIKHLHKKRASGRRNSKSAFVEMPGKWFDNADTLPCHFARVAFRDVTNRTNQRTVIVALVPPRCFIANQAPFLLFVRGDEQDQAFLVGVLASISLDWYARRFVEKHVSFYVFNPFPIPRPDRHNPLWQRTVALAGRLACPDKRFAKWAKAVGVECGKLDAAEKDDMIAELDAVVAHLYGLSEPQLTHIFETFHEGWNYQPRLTAVLEHYRTWANKY